MYQTSRVSDKNLFGSTNLVSDVDGREIVYKLYSLDMTTYYFTAFSTYTFIISRNFHHNSLLPVRVCMSLLAYVCMCMYVSAVSDCV